MKIINTLPKTLFLFFFIISSGTIIAAKDILPKINTFEFRNEIAPLNSYIHLINKPYAIETRILPKKVDDIDTLDILFDFHAIYDITIEKLIKKVLDLDKEQYVFPRMIYTKDLNPDDHLWEPHLQEVKTQFRFGLFEQNYHYIFYKIPTLNRDGSFLIKWNLYNSIDEKFTFIYGSWYINQIFINNKKYSYVRNYIHYGMKNYPFYIEFAMNIGGANDTIAFLDALKKAAE